MSDSARIISGVDYYLIYLRKSRQDDPNETIEEVLEKHERILQEYALKNFGFRIKADNIYREVVSGETIDDRPMIQELYRRLEKEDIKGVLVVDPQRLTRGDLLDCGITVRTFKYTDTLIITPNKSYNLNDKYDRKLFEMELSRGSDYLEYTKEILRRGREASVRRGNYIGSEPPYGYDRVKIDKNWTLKPNDKEMPYVQLAFKMYLEGIGTGTIAAELDKLGAKPRISDHMSKATIVQMLRNPVYIGKLKLNSRPQTKTIENGKMVKKRKRMKDYELVDGCHEPIISEEVFEMVQEKIKNRSKEKKDVELQFIYAGIMKCVDCHKAVRLFKCERYKDMPYYRRAKDRICCTYKKHCGNMGHNFIEVHEAILSELKRYLEDFEVQVNAANNCKDNNSHEMFLESLLNRLEDNQNKFDDICEYLENGIYTVDMFVKRKKALEDERDTIKKAIEKEKENQNKSINLENKIVSLHKALDMLNDDTISAKTKNEFLKNIIDVIYFGKKGTRENYKITLDIHLK